MTATIAIDFAPLATGLYLEALAVDDRTAWFGDAIGGGAFRLEPDGTARAFLPERRWYGGLAFNDDGLILASGHDGIVWLDPDTGDTGSLLDEIPGSPFSGTNDLCPDGRGGLYFGSQDPGITEGNAPRPSALYHIDAERNVRQLAGGLAFTNGIQISRDRSTLFHNETFNATFAYPVLADGSLGERQVLLEKEDCDGMVLDAEDNLWIVGYASGEILRVTPDGHVIGKVPVPGGAVTNIRFGGDGRDLYATSVPFDAGEGLRVGILPTEPRSTLYRGRSPIAGRVAPPTSFRIN
jgi:sugar lactone lactonase YvrE